MRAGGRELLPLAFGWRIVSASGRRARFYALTPIGRKEMTRETANWERMAGMMARFLAGGAENRE